MYPKRALDLVLAVAGVICLSPLMLVIVILVRCTSTGGAVFAQKRVGLNERVFTCLKFRTMAVGSPDVGSHDADRSWITPFGAFLRKTKLDELPQLINVIKGEMSLVGPRPCLPSQTELIKARRNFGVFRIRPGITGFSQVRGIDMSRPWQLAEMDASYISEISLRLDLSLLIDTIRGKGAGDGSRNAL